MRLFCRIRRKFREFLARAEAKAAAHEAEWKAEQLARRGTNFLTGGGKPEPQILLYQPPDEDVSIGPDWPMDKVNAALDKQDKIRLDELQIGESRFGGVPDLPDNLSWPEFKGKKLPFLAQIDLSKLPKSLLPAEGWLLVFGLADSEEDKTPVRILHHRGPREELKRCPIPSKKEIWTDCGSRTYSVLALKASPEKDWTEAGWLLGAFEEEDAAGIADEQDCSGDDWITLLAIESVGSMVWSDCGKFHFAIRRSDLEKGDFAKVCAGLSEVG